MQEIPESDAAAIETVEKDANMRRRLWNEADRKGDWCRGCAHWIMKWLRKQPQVRRWDTKRTGIGLRQEEEMGVAIADGCIRTWVRREMWFTLIMSVSVLKLRDRSNTNYDRLVFLMNLLHMFEESKGVILKRALLEAGNAARWNMGQAVVLMRVMGIGGIVGRERSGIHEMLVELTES